MAQTLIQNKPEYKLIDRINNLENIINAIRSNQNKKVTFGSIIVDGTTAIGTITFTTAGANLIFQSGGLTIGELTYFGGSNEMIFRTFETADASRISYVTLDIFKSDLVTREAFFQISLEYTSGTFTQSGLAFGVDGAAAALDVRITDKPTGYGWMKIPWNSSDPGGINAGTIYFSQSTGKFRVYNGSWHDIITT